MSTPLSIRVLVLVGLLGLPACETATTGDAPSASTEKRDERIRLTDVPPPPGVAPALIQPLDQAALGLAQLSREQVVAALDQPSYLATRGESMTPPSANPPLAAQKFYASGKQALLENDNFRAVQQLEKALRLAPGQPSILRSLAEAWTRAGNRVSAGNFYRQAFAADPSDFDSLFMLGRFALDERQWDQAILNLDAALQLAAAPEETDRPAADPINHDPAAARLIRFYLANALNQAGHAGAAAEIFADYLNDAQRYTSVSPYARELSIIDAQRGETLMLVGDLHHRLHQPRAALDVYRAAQQIGMLNPDTLRRRLLYTRLRLGQTRSAQALVAEVVADSKGDAKVLELIPYAAEHGVSVDGLTRQLTDLYQSQGRPASLALAMADVLPPDTAARLLERHLADKPGDDVVLGRLIALLLGESPRPEAVRQAITVTADAMAGSPDLAENYADRLLARVDDPGTLLDHFPPVSADENADLDPTYAAVLATLHGKIFLAHAQPDAARGRFAEALRLDPDQQLARIESADLALHQNDYEAAEALLRPLADSTHPRVAALRVQALTATDQHEEALTLLDGVLRRSPPGSPLMLDKAELLLKLDRVEEAERTLLDALNARPTDESIYVALLDIYDQRGDMTRNYQRLVRRMIDTIPHARITRLVKAETLVAMRQYPAALKELDALDEADGDRLLIQRLRLEAYLGTNQAEAAASLIEQHIAEAKAAGNAPDREMLKLALRHFIRVDQADAVTSLIDQHLAEANAAGNPPDKELLTLAVRYFSGTNRADALSSLIDQHFAEARAGSYLPYDEVLSLAVRFFSQSEDRDRALTIETRRWEVKPASRPRSETLGQLYYIQERYEDAVTVAQEAFDQGLAGADPMPFSSLLVNALLKLDRADDAEQHIQATVDAHPETGGDLNMLLAMVYENQGNTAASRRVMEAALEQFPNHAGLNNSLGYGLANEGIRLDDAQRMVARAVAAEPGTSAYLDSMGWVFYKKGEFAEALDWLERGRAGDGGTHPVIVDHHGDTLYRLGREAEAVRVWNEGQRTLSAEGYQPVDPEEDGLPERLEAKIQAVAGGRPAPVAALGQGVSLPEPEALPQAVPAPVNPDPAVSEPPPGEPRESAPATPLPAPQIDEAMGD